MARTRVLSSEEDAFGQVLSASFKGEEAYEVVERDDGYIDAMSTKGYFSEYSDWPPFEQQAIDLARGEVLDVGCGAGRHSLYLQKRGFDVLGIDVSPLAVEVCKQRGLKKARLMPIDDVHKLKPNTFGTVLMMGNNFGLLASARRAKLLLKKMHGITTKDALIMAVTRDPYKTQNPAHLEYHKRNKKKGRMGGQVRLRVRHGKRATPWFDYLMVSIGEMKQILQGTGWKIRDIKEPDDKSALGVSCYIAIIEKT
jgi:SAM-dependent methyltransferase